MKMKIIENVIIEGTVVEPGTELDPDPQAAANLIRIGCAKEMKAEIPAEQKDETPVSGGYTAPSKSKKRKKK